MNRLASFKKGLKAGIPIALGYFAVSFSFGILVVSDGLSVLDAVIISATNLTSAGQFAGLRVINAMGSYLEMFLIELITNLRYFFMSFSLSQKFRNDEPFIYKMIAGYGVTDEIFAISIKQVGKVSTFFNIGAMVIAIQGWVLGTFTGAYLGNILPNSVTSALSVSLFGMFIAIVVPPAKNDKHIMHAVIWAMILSTLFEYAHVLNKVSSGFSLIIVTVVVSTMAAILAPIKEDSHE